MVWVSSRLRERSTWAGLLAILSLLLGKAFPDALAMGITDAGVAVGGVLAVIMREREV
jgi:hypothetical protein